MGDVAMTAPILKEFAEQNSEVELIIVSRPHFKAFFQFVPNAQFIGIDFNDYKAIHGLRKLASELKKYEPSMIADLHNVLRTKILKLFLLFSVKQTATLDKGRKERKVLTRKKNKVLKPLCPMSERYADVFRKLGFDLTLSHKAFPIQDKTKIDIGIAPFANYREKMYPLENMKDICLELANQGKNIYLFGGGVNETKLLREWEDLHPNIHNLSKIPLTEQINTIGNLAMMISMDSANMHIASLVGTRVISIWGATHPFAGFLGYGQKQEDIIQLEDLYCRPCSIFGNKPCYRKDWACMKNLQKKIILSKINTVFMK